MAAKLESRRSVDNFAASHGGIFRMRSIRRSLLSALLVAIVALFAFSVSGCQMWGGGEVDSGAVPVSTRFPVNDGFFRILSTDVVYVTLSTDLDSTTVNDNTFYVTGSEGVPIAGTVVYRSHGNDYLPDITFTPTSPLSPGTLYTVTLTTGIRSVSGGAYSSPYTWSFWTIPTASATSTTVLNATDNIIIRLTSSIVSASIDNGINVDNGSLVVLDDSDTPISGTVRSHDNTLLFTSHDNTLVFTPTVPLDYGSVYTVSVSPTVRTVAGIVGLTAGTVDVETVQEPPAIATPWNSQFVSFGPPTTASGNTFVTGANRLVSAIDAAGNIFTAWVEFPATGAVVKAAKFAVSTHTKTEYAVSRPEVDNICNLVGMIGADGAFTLAWEEVAGYERTVNAARILSGGSALVQADSNLDLGDAAFPALVGNGDGGVRMYWPVRSAEMTYYRYRDCATGSISWTAPEFTGRTSTVTASAGLSVVGTAAGQHLIEIGDSSGKALFTYTPDVGFSDLVHPTGTDLVDHLVTGINDDGEGVLAWTDFVASSVRARARRIQVNRMTGAITMAATGSMTVTAQTTDNSARGMLAVAMSENDTATVVWRERTTNDATGTASVWASQSAGFAGSWSAPLQIGSTGDGGNYVVPSVVAYGNGFVLAGWLENPGSLQYNIWSPEIWPRGNPADGWLGPVTLDPGTSDYADVSFTAGPKGHMGVVYHSLSTGDLYYGTPN